MNDIVFAGQHALMRTVQRHAHESWEFVYCTYGTGAFRFDSGLITYKKGDVVVIPPMMAHSNASEKGFRNIHVNMTQPTFSLQEPTVIHDDDNHFLLDAFRAALFHYLSDRPEKERFLSAYGNLISCYLAAYQTVRRLSRVVKEIEQQIISHYDDPSFELDVYLKSLPFNYDYLRKLFQKEMLVTPLQYLNNRRLQVAADALMSAAGKPVNITDVARMCGFREPLYFSRMFKKKYGVAPSFYLQSRQSVEKPDEESVKITLEDA